MARLIGTDQDDTLHGGVRRDTIKGLDGNDLLIDDGSPNDIANPGVMEGGAGDDTITAASGVNLLEGGKGNDLVTGGSGHDDIFGDKGRDRLEGGGADDFILGGAGNDRIFGGDDIDYLYGDDGDDEVDGGLGADYLEGGLGDDKLDGGDGDDTIFGDPNFRFGVIQSETLRGGLGDDAIYAAVSDGVSKVYGEDGADTVQAGFNDVVFGGAGDDLVQVFGDGSLVEGGRGNDVLATTGASSLYGGAGDDTLIAGNAADVFAGKLFASGEVSAGGTSLDGDPLYEAMFGGPGANVYVVGSETIFSQGTMRIMRVGLTALDPEDVINIRVVNPSHTLEQSQISASYDSVDGVTTVGIDIDNNGTPDGFILIEGNWEGITIDRFVT